jgi:predicted MFS family arabinose efflux permease
MVTPALLNQSPSRHLRNNGSRVLLTACVAVFVGFGSLFISTFGVFLKPLAASFGWSRSQVSIGFTAAVLSVAVCSPFLGRFLDRFPARRVVLPCTLIYGLGFASLSLLTPHLWHFVLTLAILGVVGNGTTQLGYARVVSTWFDQSRGQALAAVMAGSGFGFMILPPLAQALISNFGWRIAFAFLGGMILLTALPLGILFLHEPNRTESNPAKQESTGISKDILSPRFLMILLGLLLFSLATNGLNTHWAALLTDRGLSPATAAAVLSACGFATLASKLSTGYFIDRFFAARVAACLFAVCACGFVGIIYGHSSWVAFAAAALVGIGMGAESDTVPYLLTRYFGLERFGELYGYTWCIYAVAGGAGPLLAGVIFDKSGSYQSALFIFLAMVLVSGAIFASLPKYKNLV